MKLQQQRGYPTKTPLFGEFILHPSQWNREHWSYDDALRTKRTRRRQSKPSAMDIALKLLSELKTEKVGASA